MSIPLADLDVELHRALFTNVSTTGTSGYSIAATTGTFESPIDAPLADMLYAAAGASSPGDAIFLSFFMASWILQPIAFVQTRSFYCMCGLRSDVWASVLIEIVLPTITFTLMLERDLFTWIKSVSVMSARILILLVKHVFPPPDRILDLPLLGERRAVVLYSWLVHGALVVIMAEACILELGFLQGEPYNYINGGAGVAVTLMTIVYAKNFKVSIDERDEIRKRELRANLSPLYILAHTVWSVQYHVVYHAEKAVYYIILTLLMPLVAALLGMHDWLEIRSIALLHAMVLRLFPIHLPSACLFLGIDVMESAVFRTILSVITLVLALALFVEVRHIIKGGKPFEAPFGLTSRIHVDDTFRRISKRFAHHISFASSISPTETQGQDR